MSERFTQWSHFNTPKHDAEQNETWLVALPVIHMASLGRALSIQSDQSSQTFSRQSEMGLTAEHKIQGQGWIQIQLLPSYIYLNLSVSTPWSLNLPISTPKPTHLHP